MTKRAPAGLLSHDRQVRDSTLLLLGRALSIALNLATQILAIRYLIKSDYGAFAYALAIVEYLAQFVRLGQDRVVARYVPLYEREGRYAQARACIWFCMQVVLVLGTGVCLLALAVYGAIPWEVGSSSQIAALILIMIVLAPVGALDAVLIAVLSALGRSKAMFVRMYVARPLLRLSAVLITLAAEGSVSFLALGYMVTGVVGLAIYAPLMSTVRKDLTGVADQQDLVQPSRRSWLRFSLPTFGSELVIAGGHLLVLIALELLRGLDDVAELRAVMPAALLNVIAAQSFVLLYLPLASRLYADKRLKEIIETSSRTALWALVLTLPLLALCVVLPEELIGLLMGQAYVSAAPVLVTLSVGFFIGSMSVQVQASLRALGAVRALMVCDLAGLVVICFLAFLLIERFGALGAAWAIGAGQVVVSLAKLFLLGRVAGMAPIPADHTVAYAVVACCTGGLVWYGLQVSSVELSLLVTFLLLMLAFIACRRSMKLGDVFPEIQRMPAAIRWIFGA